MANAFVGEIEIPAAIRTRVRQLQQSKVRLDSLLTEVLLAEMDALDSTQRTRYIDMSPWSRRYKERPQRGNRPAR